MFCEKTKGSETEVSNFTLLMIFFFSNYSNKKHTHSQISNIHLYRSTEDVQCCILNENLLLCSFISCFLPSFLQDILMKLHVTISATLVQMAGVGMLMKGLNYAEEPLSLSLPRSIWLVPFGYIGSGM